MVEQGKTSPEMPKATPTTSDIIGGKNKNDYLASIVVLVCVVLFTVGLYVYNSYFLQKDIAKLQTQIAETQADIEKVEEDENVQIYALLKANKKAIEVLTERSAVTNFITHLDEITEKYGIEFETFHLAEGNITTKATSLTTETEISYDKVSNFIKFYREDEASPFDLGFVNGVSGTDKIAFNVLFSLK